MSRADARADAEEMDDILQHLECLLVPDCGLEVRYGRLVDVLIASSCFAMISNFSQLVSDYSALETYLNTPQISQVKNKLKSAECVRAECVTFSGQYCIFGPPAPPQIGPCLVPPGDLICKKP